MARGAKTALLFHHFLMLSFFFVLLAIIVLPPRCHHITLKKGKVQVVLNCGKKDAGMKKVNLVTEWSELICIC